MKTIVRPLKLAGRVVVGPRQVQSGYARIVACEDGSGRIELYDAATRSWTDGAAMCTFSEIWSATASAEPGPDAPFDMYHQFNPVSVTDSDDIDIDDSEEVDVEQPDPL